MTKEEWDKLTDEEKWLHFRAYDDTAWFEEQMHTAFEKQRKERVQRVKSHLVSSSVRPVPSSLLDDD